MRIALVGTGQMGSAVEGLAGELGHVVVSRFDENRLLTDAADSGVLEQADVAIEFSLPDGAVDNIRRYCAWGVPAVVGTTGWYDAIDEVNELVTSSGGTLLYAPNFSLGIALMVRALRGVAPLLDRLPEYDAFVHEVHHVRKVDSPSGTALMLGRTLLDGLERKKRLETETQHGRIEPDALHVTSARAGTVFGEHTVGLDSRFDRLGITHEAKGREGFAFGAIRSAEWLVGKKGVFTLDDVLDDWVG